MLVVSAVVLGVVALNARDEFRVPAGAYETRGAFAFWILLLGVWAGLATVFLSGDLFTLYVALELLTFAAVPLVSLDGRPETLRAALRYLIFAVLGSASYLGGAALLYGAYGTLDVVLLSHAVCADAPTLVAAALMTVGLLGKTALVPLHLWLPPAHAGAPAPASAVLSALVVKGSFFIIVRLWFDVMPALPGPAAARLLGALGAVAIVFGSVLALRQERLKLLVAYSTLAQLGYLFLMFPLAVDPASGHLVSGDALTAGMVQTASHATAKAAMFLAAGAIYAALGHDRIAGLAGAARALARADARLRPGGHRAHRCGPQRCEHREEAAARRLRNDRAARDGRWCSRREGSSPPGTSAGPRACLAAIPSAAGGSTDRVARPWARCGADPGGRLAAARDWARSGPLLPRSALSNPLSPTELWSTALLVAGGRDPGRRAGPGAAPPLDRRRRGSTPRHGGAAGRSVRTGRRCAPSVAGGVRGAARAGRAVRWADASDGAVARPRGLRDPRPHVRKERVRQQAEGRVGIDHQGPQLAAGGQRAELDAGVVRGIGHEPVEAVVHRERHGHVR